MKRMIKIAGLSLGVVAALGFTSCTNELNNLSSNNGSNGLSLAKAPDITAWSGSHYLTPANGTTDTRAYENFVAIAQAQAQAQAEIQTRAESTTSYDYNFPDEMSKLDNISIPTDAQELKDEGNTNYDLNKPILIPEGKTVTTQVPNNFGGQLYIAGTYNPSQLGNNSNNLKIYILEGGELTYNSINNNNGTIYNAGTLNILNGFDGNKIENIYNIGLVNITNCNPLPDAVSIYSNGGNIEFKGNNTLINGKIISNNIVHAGGNIKFQNSKDRDICWLKADGLVEITDNTNIFGQITAPNLKFDGAKIKLHPNGLIDIKGDINAPNSATGIIAFDDNSKGLVICNKFTSINDPLDVVLSSGIYLNCLEHNWGLNMSIERQQAMQSRINTANPYDFNPGCGGEGEGNGDVTDPEDPCPGSHGDKCKHPGSIHDEEGYCPDCGEEDPCYDNRCPQCHHPSHEPGECPVENCPEEDCHPTPEPEQPEGPKDPDPGSEEMLCPLCDHDITYLEAKGIFVHVNNKSKIGEPCGECKDLHIVSLCSNEALNNALKGKTSSEVEVNLSINDKDNQMDIKHLVTKLSIHVRYPADVKIIIPIKGAYQVDQDDLAIFNEHYGKESVYGGNTSSVTYKLGDNSVTLTIQHDFDGNKIVVTTHGINPEVFNYCRENYGDGLNFEIYSYFNYLKEEDNKFVSVDNSEYDEVFSKVKEEYLNKSTIEFIYYNEDKITPPGDCPNYYINAFNDTQDNVRGEKDCTVSVVEGQEDYFSVGKEECHHLNGSKYNVIYTNTKYIKCPEGEHDHDFLWKYQPIESLTDNGVQQEEGL